MPPDSTADSAINLADPVVVGMTAVFAMAVLIAVSRWVWLVVRGLVQRRLSRKQVAEVIALSLALAALAAVLGYAIVVSAEAAAWSR